MTGAEQGLHCLICRVPITHADLEIDSCRACAVFYKRTLNHKRPIKCKGGANDCLSDACAGETPDSTVMASYLTYVNDETVERFFDDCPYAVNKKEAAQLFSKNMKRTAVPNRAHFRKVKPSGEEFIALFGLALWNDNTASISADLSQLVNRNRAAIMDELHKMYANRGFTDYAARLGELLCLLVNVETALEVTNEDIEVYRMMNLFNEAFEDAPRVLPIDRMQI